MCLCDIIFIARPGPETRRGLPYTNTQTMSSRIEILNDGGKLRPTYLPSLIHECQLTQCPGLRHDARRPYELRSLSFQLLPHPQADGSATVSQGLTSVQVAIYGPREPKSKSNSNAERAVISVEVGVVPWAQSGGAKRSRGDRYVPSSLPES